MLSHCYPAATDTVVRGYRLKFPWTCAHAALPVLLYFRRWRLNQFGSPATLSPSRIISVNIADGVTSDEAYSGQLKNISISLSATISLRAAEPNRATPGFHPAVRRRYCAFTACSSVSIATVPVSCGPSGSVEVSRVICSAATTCSEVAARNNSGV